MTVLTLLLSSLPLIPQARALGPVQQLERLGNRIEQAAAILQFMPANTDVAIIQEIRNTLQTARDKYQQGRTAVNNENLVRLRILNAEILALLKRVESLIRTNPVFQFRFQEELENRLQTAEALIQNTDNREVLYMLERARFYRQRAYLYHRQERFFSALENFRLALHFVDQAIRLIGRSDAVDPQDLMLMLKETQVVLERARQVGEENPEAGNQRLLQKAETEIRTVERMIEEQNLVGARQKLNAINKVLYRIIDVAVKIPANDKGRARGDIESAEAALEIAQERMSGNSSAAATTLLARTEALLNSARQHLVRGEIVRARRKAMLASRLITNIYRIVDQAQQPSQLDIQTRIQSARQSITGIRQIEKQWEDLPAFQTLLNRNVNLAEEALSNNRPQESILRLKIVNGLILRLNRMFLEDEQQHQAEAAAISDLKQLSSLMVELETRKASLNEEMFIRLNNAEALRKLAENSCNQGNYPVCRMLARTAATIINQSN